MRAQKGDDLARRGRLSGEIGERVEQPRDLGAEPAMRHRGSLQLGRPVGQRQPHRRPVACGDGTAGDLGEVVVFGLQPEERHAAHARFVLDGTRGGDRRRCLVKRVERAEEKSHLLPADDHRGAPTRQSFQIPVPRRARGQRRLLLGERREQRRVDLPLRRLARGRDPHRALAEVAGQERRRGRITGEVRGRE